MATVMQWCGAVARRMMISHRSASVSTLSSPLSSTPTPTNGFSLAEPILCGRGDKRTKKGKRFKGSYGNARPKKKEMIQRFKDKVEVPRSTPWPLPFKVI